MFIFSLRFNEKYYISLEDLWSANSNVTACRHSKVIKKYSFGLSSIAWCFGCTTRPTLLEVFCLHAMSSCRNGEDCAHFKMISHSTTPLPKLCAGKTIRSENRLHGTLVRNCSNRINSILWLWRYIWQIHVFVHTLVTPVPIFPFILSRFSKPCAIWL